MKTYNIGVIGTGYISNAFAEAVGVVENANVYAVGSRNLETAKEFMRKHRAKVAYGSYEELFEDENVDIVYIGTPMSSHYQNMLDILAKDKHILCEKSFTLNANEAREIKNIAHKKQLYVMEALWTRFNPTMLEIVDRVKKGEIGELKSIDVEFSLYFDYDETSRIFSNELGGGALLDVGIYPITFADLFLGVKDCKVSSTARTCSTGVDTGAKVLLEKSGVKARLQFGTRKQGKNLGILNGTKGRIILKDFWMTEHAEIIKEDKINEIVEIPFKKNGLEYQLIHMIERIDKGDIESNIHPLDKTIEIMSFMDSLRSEWGVVFKTEKREK